MGKFQLDSKGKALVQQFHEKHSQTRTDKKSRVKELQVQFLAKTGKK